ncbi:hypothetical protein DFH08DRAFT_822255 [Mycena albidolilacea]|uniref:Uncharacterized protein n=1 Tax=Mycena albidolilacea TaxID=1033008 RepID=A0AAD6Z8B9_9AGAR|nr:hypothetical protein DFH08DRAFT_822255 [Mycena albidolilacea]
MLKIQTALRAILGPSDPDAHVLGFSTSEEKPNLPMVVVAAFRKVEQQGAPNTRNYSQIATRTLGRGLDLWGQEGVGREAEGEFQGPRILQRDGTPGSTKSRTEEREWLWKPLSFRPQYPPDTMARPKQHKQPVLSQADLQREADAKYRICNFTFRKPEVREKNKLRMAEKRASAKLRRRKWDPPKPAKNNSEASLTPAENLALAVLTGMLHNENEIPARPLDLDAESPVQLRRVKFHCHRDLGSDFIGDREESPTRGSSVAAVQEHPILVPPPCDLWVTKRHKPLPGYVTGETPLQKQMRRELGMIGLLTPVEVAQIKTVKLAQPSQRSHEEDGRFDVTPGIRTPFLSSACRESIRQWMVNLPGSGADWDSSGQGEPEQAGQSAAP